jgi:hypothetical protein
MQDLVDEYIVYRNGHTSLHIFVPFQLYRNLSRFSEFVYIAMMKLSMSAVFGYMEMPT